MALNSKGPKTDRLARTVQKVMGAASVTESALVLEVRQRHDAATDLRRVEVTRWARPALALASRARDR